MGFLARISGLATARILALTVIAVLLFLGVEAAPIVRQGSRTTTVTTNSEPYVHGAAPLYKAVKPISYEEYLRWVKKQRFTIYLPTWLPEGLKPVAVWKKGSYALIAYARGPVKTYEEAPLTLEVMPARCVVTTWKGEATHFKNVYARADRVYVSGKFLIAIYENYKPIDRPISYNCADVEILSDEKECIITYALFSAYSTVITPETLLKIIWSMEPVK